MDGAGYLDRRGPAFFCLPGAEGRARGAVAGRRGTCVGGWGGLMQVRRGLTGPQSSRPGLLVCSALYLFAEPPFLVLRLA